jgi:2-polyprenyl-6-methoxyphenol hydroxylase-like FAD-dependent oxidoreductase
MWGVTAPADVYGPALFELVRLGDLGYVVPATIQTSERPAWWSPVPVTLLGDAAHPMPPAGISAGVAIHDAGLGASRLVSGAPLLDAVRSYETEMLDHGFAAVATATRNYAGEYSGSRAGDSSAPALPALADRARPVRARRRHGAPSAIA